MSTFALEFTRSQSADDPQAFLFEPQRYTLRTPGGGAAVVEVDWDDALLADLDSLRQPGCPPAVVQRVGERLAGFLKQTDWSAQARAIALSTDRVEVTVRSNAAELYALPWELLTIPDTGQHLGGLEHVLIRYEWPETKTAAEQPSPRPEGGRVLLAWSAAGGAVPVGEQEEAIRAACASGHPFGADALDILPHASLDAVAKQLDEGASSDKPYAVLHILCHGGRRDSTYGLVLDGDGTPAIVTAGLWRRVLAPHAKHLHLVVLVACDGGNVGEPGNHLGSVAQALHRVGIEAVLASRFPLTANGSVTLTSEFYDELLSTPSSVETALLRARRSLSLTATGFDWASLQLHARERDGGDSRPVVIRPYRGLYAFEAEQSRFFFGRKAERDETLSDLEALVSSGSPRFLVVAGASGTGKSSLVRSGAVPDILARAGEQWEHAVMRPGSAPTTALNDTLANRADETRPFLLVVDQFEELFTQTPTHKERQDFAQRLWTLAQGGTKIHCIITLRVDFLGRCGDLVLDEAEGTRLDTIAYKEEFRVFVAQMSPHQLREAIEEPARRVGLTFQEGLVDRILADAGVEPGALPLVQYTLEQLWERRVGCELKASVYEELGGVVGALQRQADDIVEQMSGEELRAARRLLTRLVGVSEDETADTRQRVPIEMLLPNEPEQRAASERVLQHLVNARLLVRDDRDKAGATYEIAHEALIRKWEQLRGWLKDVRSHQIGRYIVTRSLDSGSTGEVFEAHDPQLGRKVALKLLRVGRRSAEIRARMLDRGKQLAQLHHPNVLTVYDVGVVRGQVFVAMEWVEGQTMRTWQDAERRSWREILARYTSAAGGLAAAHARGLLHTRFSPENVFVAKDGRILVGDFGLSRDEENLPDHAGLAERSTSQRVAGTPGYMAPEQLVDGEVDARADQFAYCVTAWEALFGERPLSDETRLELAANVVSGTVRPAPKNTHSKRVPGWLRRVFLRGLSIDPDRSARGPAGHRSELRANHGREGDAMARRRGGRLARGADGRVPVDASGEGVERGDAGPRDMVPGRAPG